MNTTTKASLGATVILLVVALVVAVQNMSELKSARGKVADLDARIEDLKGQVEHERQVYKDLLTRTKAQPAPAVAVASASPELEEKYDALQLEIARKTAEIEAQKEEKKLLVERVENKEIVSEENLTEVQRKIRDAASIGEISAVQDELGFAVITAGTKAGIEPGIQFAIRRDVVIVGKVMVDSVEDANSSIVNIVQGSVQPGQKIQPGDTVIAFPIY